MISFLLQAIVTAAIHLSANGDALILQRGNLFRLRHASTLKRSQTDSQGAEQSGMDAKKCAVSGLIEKLIMTHLFL
jgi:hypothetical protein